MKTPKINVFLSIRGQAIELGNFWSGRSISSLKNPSPPPLLTFKNPSASSSSSSSDWCPRENPRSLSGTKAENFEFDLFDGHLPPCCPPRPPCCHPNLGPRHQTDVLAKIPGLYQGPKLRILNLNFLGRMEGGTDRVTYISVGRG